MMHTRYFDLRDTKGQQKIIEDQISAAADILRQGGLVGIPTETVYGLGANALDAEAVNKIFEAKGRPQDNPLIIHVPGPQWLPRYCEDVPPLAYTLARKFWPGPLTMILKRKPIVPDATTAGLDTVGVRCPDHQVTLSIIREAGVPVAAPSANTSGRPSCTTAADVMEDMEGKIDAVVDGGPCQVGVESTILDLTCTPPRLLRPGGLPLEALEEVVGPVAVDKAVTERLKDGEQPKAPGMKYRHYAPKAPVTVVTGPAEASARTILQMVKPGDGVICFDEFAELFKEQEVECLGPSQDKRIQAQRVFDALRAFDSKDAAQIYAQCPDSQGLGLAISNRLKKAAGFKTIAAGQKRVVIGITGGTGSFGNAVLNRFLDTDIREIRIFSRDEKKQDDMRHEFQAKMPEAAGKIKFFIGDVRDLASVKNAMHGVDYIFHAAALKQVPSCEFFPMEAVKTNVFGTDNVLTAAIDAGVKAVICLSTDKAAYPVNAMGTSKAMMEKVAIAKGRALGEEAGTTICCTRYGNVMASRGSVIPLWVEQIKNGRPITVTDPNMTRFMMTLDDAVDLVIYAFEHGHNGDLFVQKAPAATLDVLAQALKETYAQVDPKYGETEVKTIGTRHGEKLYETLVTREEMAKAVDMGDYYRIPCDTRDLNYDKFFTEGNEDIARIEDYHSHNTARLDVEGMKKLLLKLRFIREDLGMEEKAKSAEIKSE